MVKRVVWDRPAVGLSDYEFEAIICQINGFNDSIIEAYVDMDAEPVWECRCADVF